MSALFDKLKALAPSLRRVGAPVLAAFLVLNFSLTPAIRQVARADTFDDVAGWVDKINTATGGALPFSGDQLRSYRTVIVTCDSASGADDMVACVEQASATDVAQQNGVPSWFPKMLNVYFDIEHKDYWGLLEDGGEAVACAAAQVIGFGVDICGAIQDLIDAAKDIVSAAEAIGKFFADLGSDIKDIGQDIYCWFAGCDDSPPPPSPDAVAYKNFFFPRINTGLLKRLNGHDTWVKYAGDPAYNPQAASVLYEPDAKNYSFNALVAALPAFRAAVYSQWDQAILTQYAPGARQAAQSFDFNAAKQYAQIGIGQWNDGLIDSLSGSGAIPLPLMNPGMSACQAKVAASGGPQVDAWVQEGGPKGGPTHPNVPPGFQWPGGSTGGSYELCSGFGQQLAADLHPLVASRAAIRLQQICENKGGNPNVYACSMYAVQNCKNILAFTKLPNAVCTNTSPNPGTSKGTFVCQPGNKVVQLVLTGPIPAGCHLASVQNPPPQNNGPTGPGQVR